MSKAIKVTIIIIGVFVAIALLFLLLQAATTDPAEAAGKEDPQTLGPAPYEYELADPVVVPLPDKPITMAAGCANATVKGKIETSVVGWDVMNAQIWQSFCWAHGHITSLGRVRKQMDVTTWGNAHGWREDGWRDGPDGWTNYGNKFHGGHYAVKTAKFKACVPFPTGCVDSNHATIRLSLLQHAGGDWWGGVGK